MWNRVLAELLLAAHVCLVLFVLFGWLYPNVWILYTAALVTTLLSDVLFGYCVLSKWEFDLRKRHDPTIDYNYTWASYYTHKLTQHRISDGFYWHASVFSLSALTVISLYFHTVA